MADGEVRDGPTRWAGMEHTLRRTGTAVEGNQRGIGTNEMRNSGMEADDEDAAIGTVSYVLVHAGFKDPRQ